MFIYFQFVQSSSAPLFVTLAAHPAFAQTFLLLSRYDLNYTQYIEYCQEIGYVNIKVVIKMISYTPFYETLFKKGITEYNLIFKQGFSANTIHRIKKGEAISTKTLDALCYALDCNVNDIIEFIKE